MQVILVWLRYQEYLRRTRNQRKRKSPAVWVKKFLRLRPQEGHYQTLIRHLRDPTSVGHEQEFQNYFRMDAALFTEILDIVGPVIEKMDTDFR